MIAVNRPATNAKVVDVVASIMMRLRRLTQRSAEEAIEALRYVLKGLSASSCTVTGIGECRRYRWVGVGCWGLNDRVRVSTTNFGPRPKTVMMATTKLNLESEVVCARCIQ